MSNRVKTGLKTLLTVVLLGILALHMNLTDFARELSSIHWVLLLGSVLVQSASVPVSVGRWQLILWSFSIRTSFLRLLKITYIGHFFNLFLPSAIGGDFFRAWYLSRHEGRGMSTTLTTTFLERSAGLAALLAIGTLSAAIYRIEVQGVWLLYVFLPLIGGFLLANVVLFHSRLHRGITRFLHRRGKKDIEEKMALVSRGLQKLRSSGWTIAGSLFFSLAIQFKSVVVMWIAALSIGVEASFFVFLIFIPIVNLTIMVPLTINGFGLREGVYALLFAQIGMPTEKAVTLSLLNFLVVALASLPGALIYSLYKKQESFDPILPDERGSEESVASGATGANRS